MLLENINNSDDVHKLSTKECYKLVDEIRTMIIRRTSITGGHLSSNLGIIELTVALHYVFDFSKDKIVFDTSHQCYTHKILTGRKEAYLDPTQYKKYSGYTNPDESVYDLFKIGHTSTSISMACGLAKARDLKGKNCNVIAVIGDGALGGGQALEGLNFAGSEVKGNLIIILNDNQMSIAENHGGLYDHLASLRETNGKSNNNIFTAFGFKYFYEQNGNNISSLVNILRDIKDINEPVFLHISTVKGKGFESAEKYKEDSHWVKAFNIDTGIKPPIIVGERYDKIVRDFLMCKMKKDPTVVAVSAAVPNALAFDKDMRELMGEQYIDVGIMEEHAISMSAGIAKNGGKPVFSTRSTFIQRTYDQISHELGINRLAVTIILVNASIYSPTDMTHMGLFDISMISNIPNVVCLSPTNKQEYLAMLDWSIEQTMFPVVIRAPRNGVYESKDVVDKDYSNINKYKVMQKGKEVAIIAAGDFFQLGEQVAEYAHLHLNKNVTLINPRFVSGIDSKMLDELNENHRLVITLEDGMIEGGFGQKISGYYSSSDMKVLNYGFKKEFFDYYDTDKVMYENRLMPELIVEDINCILEGGVVHGESGY